MINPPEMAAGNRRLYLLFPFMLFLIPLLFFVILELTLRIAHYGKEYDLVHVIRAGDTKYYVVNKRVAGRYFSSQDFTIPDARDGIFSLKKSKNTVRIFCLGGSTTAGFPFQFNATFPSLLNDRLERLFPDKNFEVINFGISAINSYSVLDMTRELIEYDPDLFLIYMGHNEFYGAFGVASTQKIGENRTFINFYLRLEKLRTVQLIRNIIYRLRGSGLNNDKRRQTLMQAVVADNIIAKNSNSYRTAHRNFQKNLQDILSLIQQRQVPVIVSNLVSNIKDQPPFVSLFEIEGEVQKQWEELYRAGMKQYQNGDIESSIAMLNKAVALDSNPAKAYFALGRCYLKAGLIEKARNAFVRAKDYDGLRFRASSDLNDIIRSVCRAADLPFVDMEKLFSGHSPAGIIGDELMLEHLHPNFTGNYLLADGFLHAMAENNIIAAAGNWPWEKDLTMNENMANAFVTDLDLEIAWRRITRLTSQWPFKKAKTFPRNYQPEYARFLDRITEQVLAGSISWNEGHYKMGDYFFQNKMFQKAENEFRAVLKVTPGNYYPWLYLGNALMAQKNYKASEAAYNRAVSLSPSLPFGYAKLGMLYIQTNRPADAVKALEMSIEVDKKSPIFNPSELGRAYYLYALALAQSRQLTQAAVQATKADSLMPGSPEVKALITQLKSAVASEN